MGNQGWPKELGQHCDKCVPSPEEQFQNSEDLEPR